MATQQAGRTPAGWYPNQESDERLRYWDGARWTEHYEPASLQVHRLAFPGPPAPTKAGSSREAQR